MQKSSFFGIIELRKTITPQGDYTTMKRNIQLLISEEFAKKTIPENGSGAMAYDINKLRRKIQNNRTGIQLHGKLSA